MKFYKHLTEASSIAYWISRFGELIEVGTTHVDVIIKNPKKFGYTEDKIEQLYAKHGEIVGQEGKAREEIVVDLISKGWVRVRRYKNQGYSVNINKMNKKMKDVLFDWASKLLGSGIKGVKEQDKYIPVNIQGLSDHYNRSVTIQDIANDILFEGNETFDTENSIIILESVEELHG